MCVKTKMAYGLCFWDLRKQTKYKKCCLKGKIAFSFIQESCTMNCTLYLASGSPRRREILTQLGFNVQRLSAEIDETPAPNENAHDYVRRMAVEKNRAALLAHPDHRTQVIVSADTTVALRDAILGKPTTAQHAHDMLAALSGQTHQVLTAVCVSRNGTEWVAVQSNDVTFKPLSEKKIANYIASGEPMDKAGAYGIQGVGGAFVAHLSGSFTGVMGLPVFETMALLRESGLDVPPFDLI